MVSVIVRLGKIVVFCAQKVAQLFLILSPQWRIQRTCSSSVLACAMPRSVQDLWHCYANNKTANFQQQIEPATKYRRTNTQKARAGLLIDEVVSLQEVESFE